MMVDYVVMFCAKFVGEGVIFFSRFEGCLPSKSITPAGRRSSAKFWGVYHHKFVVIPALSPFSPLCFSV